MALDGYTSITSIDFSEVVIEQMQQNQKQHLPQLQYAVADARYAGSLCWCHHIFTLQCFLLMQSQQHTRDYADTAQASVLHVVCRSMPQYTDSSFGAVLDKGTMDAMACGEKAGADIHHMLMESSRQVNTAQALPLLYSHTTTPFCSNGTLGTANRCLHSFLAQRALMLRPWLHTSSAPTSSCSDNSHCTISAH